MKQKKEKSKLRKFLDIINPRTILGQCIILGTIVVLGVLIWFITVTAISIDAFINTTADKIAFADDSDVDLDSVTRVNDEDLTEFKAYLECSKYDSSASKKASFKVYLYQEQETTTSLSGSITLKLLVTADYSVNDDDDDDLPDFYSTASNSKSASSFPSASSYDDSDVLTQSFTISNLVSLPRKTKTITLWPYSLKQVSKPIVYLYVSYTDKSNNKTHSYIIRYEYEDINFTGIVS